MHQGNWKCSSCGGAITELPFIPRGEAGLTCRSCYSQKKAGSSSPAAPDTSLAAEAPDMPEDAVIANEPPPMDDFYAPAPTEKPKFSGDWQCAGCGAAITSLPFTPRDTSNLKCIDCFKRSKA